MATKTGNSYTTGTTTDSVEIPTASPGFSTMASLNKVTPTKNGNVATKTGSTYISETKHMTDRMTIPTANLGFSTTPSMKLIPDDCDNDRQPEMVLLANLAISVSRSLSQSFS